MGEIKYKGENYTWANNWEGEGFIQERLDRCLHQLNGCYSMSRLKLDVLR